jgi:hypothetical protein
VAARPLAQAEDRLELSGVVGGLARARRLFHSTESARAACR